MELPQDIRELQQEDEAVEPVLEAVEAAKKPSPDNIAGKGPERGYLLQLCDQHVVKEGVLYQEYEEESGSGSHLQLVVPRPMRQEILQDRHGGVLGGHVGEDAELAERQVLLAWAVRGRKEVVSELS